MVKKPTANMVKQAYRISWQAKIAAALMEQVVSYLVLKKPQAIVLMEFQAAMTAGGRIPGRPLIQSSWQCGSATSLRCDASRGCARRG